MKKIKTEDALGKILCHDMTRIVPGAENTPGFKRTEFKRGHVVQEEDIPVLLSMGKEHILIIEEGEGGSEDAQLLHENDAAEALCRLSRNKMMKASELSEGKIELRAETPGVFYADEGRLNAINSIEEIVIACRRSFSPVKSGEILAAMRVIPLFIKKEKIEAAAKIAGGTPIFTLYPYKLKKAALIITGSEVKKGLVKDSFKPLMEEKLAPFGIELVHVSYPGDGLEEIGAAIKEARAAAPELIFCTGGMSVDPDDSTPGAIKRSGAGTVCYGIPVIPGSMFMLSYFEDGTAIAGVPGGALRSRKGEVPAGILDLLMPRLAAGLRFAREDFIKMANGGLCLGCKTCHFPVCPYGG